MPFKIKDVVKMASKGRTRSQGETFPLVPEQQTLTYTNNNHHRKISKSQDIERQRSTSSSTTSLRPNSMAFDNPNVVKIRPGMPHGPPSPKVSEKVEIDFDQVPFQYYTRKVENNEMTSLLKAQVLVFLLFICPSPLVFLVFLFSKCYKTSEQRKMTDQQKKETSRKFVAVGMLTLITDLLNVVLLLHFLLDTEVSTYAVLYAPVMSLWLLVAFVLPSLWFYFASMKYEFGFNVNKKKSSKSFDNFFVSSKTKDSIARKLTEQHEQFKENYENLAKMQTSSDEFLFVRKSSARYLIVCSIILGLVSCLVRTSIPLIIQLSSLTNSTGSTDIERTTIAVLSLSTFNSFIISLFVASYFIYVILWKDGMLREWKRFNANERDTRKTLVNGGPQGIAMWWKIRQSLIFFSSSSKVLSVFITKATLSIATILIMILSAVVFKMMTSSILNHHDVMPFLLDNLLLYGAILVLTSLSILIKKEQKSSGDIIELKQLNLCYELGHLMNLEQDAMDVEPGVKVKVRVFRGCLMLLQELTNVLQRFEKHSHVCLATVCLVMSSIFFCSSIGFYLVKLLTE